MTKLLITGPHVDRALTLLALIKMARNPEELARYQTQLRNMRQNDPRVYEVKEDDPRIDAKVLELRAAFAAAEGYNPPEAWRLTPPVERAAHLFGSFYTWRAAEICDEEGISRNDAAKGAVIADQRKVSRSICAEVHGRPEYGRTNCNCAAEQREREARGK